jgi:hypothetical protein
MVDQMTRSGRVALFQKSSNGGFEYKAASQNFTANVRYVESGQNHRSQKCLLIAHNGHLRIIDNAAHQRQSERVAGTLSDCSALLRRLFIVGGAL